MAQVSEYPHNFMDALEHQPRLLVVDAWVDHARRLQRYFERMGFEVHCVHDGQSAVQKIEDLEPDLLILDLNLPDVTGFDLTVRIREFHDYYLPIIVITAENEERKRLASMVSGADDYLPKPVNERDLLVRVQALLRTKIHIDRLMFEKRRLLSDLEEQNQVLEAALRAVEEADLMKRNLLNVVPHEMRTPMLQIKSAVHLLVEDVHAIDPTSPVAGLAKEAVSRMEGVIENFTNLARLESLKEEVFSLKDAISAGFRAVERNWSTKDQVHRIKIEMPDQIPLVKGDKHGVGRILMILLENAIKFDPSGKPVRLSITPEMDRGRVLVEVIDKGIGIAPDKIAYIFQAFYQVDTSETRQFGGSGIGLAIARLLAKQMHIEIQVKSKVGKGSTFYFYLLIGNLED